MPRKIKQDFMLWWGAGTVFLDRDSYCFSNISDLYAELCNTLFQTRMLISFIRSKCIDSISSPLRTAISHLNVTFSSQNLLLCATQSLFLCDSSGAQKASPTLGSGQPLPADPKINPPSFTFIQAWQFLALAVSLFVPKNNKLLWYLKLHLQRNADTK